MSRPLRIEFPDALYHVTSRGDRREEIYADDADRLAWLEVLGQTCMRFNWVVLSYCLMSNHYHVLLQTPDGNLSAGMRQLNGVYTQRSNGRHGRMGHVFQGRFKAVLVDREAYLLEVARYVVLNPVRAGMVADAGAWPWSSYGAMTGVREVPDWLDADTLLSQFAKRRSLAIARYADHVRAGVGLPSIWQQLQQQVYLGDEAFVARMLRRAGSRGENLEVPRAQRRLPGRPLEHFVGLAIPREQAMARAYASGRHSMAAIARAFGVHYATVSRAISRQEARLAAPADR